MLPGSHTAAEKSLTSEGLNQIIAHVFIPLSGVIHQRRILLRAVSESEPEGKRVSENRGGSESFGLLGRGEVGLISGDE